MRQCEAAPSRAASVLLCEWTPEQSWAAVLEKALRLNQERGAQAKQAGASSAPSREALSTQLVSAQVGVCLCRRSWLRSCLPELGLWTGAPGCRAGPNQLRAEEERRWEASVGQLPWAWESASGVCPARAGSTRTCGSLVHSSAALVGNNHLLGEEAPCLATFAIHTGSSAGAMAWCWPRPWPPRALSNPGARQKLGSGLGSEGAVVSLWRSLLAAGQAGSGDLGGSPGLVAQAAASAGWTS